MPLDLGGMSPRNIRKVTEKLALALGGQENRTIHRRLAVSVANSYTHSCQGRVFARPNLGSVTEANASSRANEIMTVLAIAVLPDLCTIARHLPTVRKNARGIEMCTNLRCLIIFSFGLFTSLSYGSVSFLAAVSSSKPLPSGIRVSSGKAVTEITALRDDVLRIRIAPNGQLPEDASWAVLPAARSQRIEVTAASDAETVGFTTKALQVQVERKTSRIVVKDTNGNILQQDAAGWPVEFHEGAFRVYKQMPDDEHYFGLGDKVGPLDRRGQAFTLWNTDAFGFQESTDPIYKSIPFFLSVQGSRVTGVFFDNTWRSSFDFGKSQHGVYSYGAEGGAIDYYILYGPAAKHVLSSYAWLTGPTPLPPLWALGYQQSRYSYETEARVREIADKLRADKIPSDAIYLDIDYQQNNRPFTVDLQKFPHFPQMLDDLKKRDFRVVAITDLHIAKLPDAGYTPYDSGMAGDHFVKNPDGSVYVGPVWPGPSVFPEFTRQATREWWGTLYRDFVSQGVAGFWNDMNEPAVFVPSKTMPENTQHRIDEPGFKSRVAGHVEIHDVFGMENCRATYEGLLKLAPNQRPFVLTRASYAGGQRYASTWTGDNSSTWNHLRMTTPMLLNLGLSGFGFSGADVGGFAGTPQPDLLTRWIQLATFQPIDRNHTEKGSADQEPWVHGLEHENNRRRYIEERYRLMPYLYTATEEMSRTGLPIVRPLFLEFPNATADGHPLDIDAGHQFLFGPNLLVAPAPFPDSLRAYQVQLPAGDWYDYWTGAKVATADKLSTLSIDPNLDTLPVYVREGAIIPMQPLTQSTNEVPQGPLTLRVYPGRDCKGSIYQDDGKSRNYLQGDSMRMQFSCEVAGNSVKLRIGAHEGTYKPWWTQLRVEVYGQRIDASYSVSGGSEALVDSEHHRVVLAVADDGHGKEIAIAPR
jgi:alpha-glucosidase